MHRSVRAVGVWPAQHYLLRGSDSRWPDVARVCGGIFGAVRASVCERPLIPGLWNRGVSRRARQDDRAVRRLCFVLSVLFGVIYVTWRLTD